MFYYICILCRIRLIGIVKVLEHMRNILFFNLWGGHHGLDHMVVGFTATCAISPYHHLFESRSCRGVLDTTLCDKVFQWLAIGLWFFPDTPASSTNKTDHHDITEILLKVALNTITLTPTPSFVKFLYESENRVGNS
jgi:hypothetical protein